ncbi:hypothetical protein [Rothia nasimurium]|uniref:hypothetical protein n=1 Tax=Rothia nasimurium TaxID=85336 RepID=UPI001F19170D|nr:hypothetical protein [Rothia nasimurium]
MAFIDESEWESFALEKEITALEEANPSDKAPAFKYLSLRRFKDLLGEHRTSATHYERAAELSLVYDRVAVASSSYFSAGKALYLSKDPAAHFKALTLLNLAKNLDQAVR